MSSVWDINYSKYVTPRWVGYQLVRIPISHAGMRYHVVEKYLVALLRRRCIVTGLQTGGGFHWEFGCSWLNFLNKVFPGDETVLRSSCEIYAW